MSIDLTELLRDSLRRDPAAKHHPGLYPSSDILGPLRHAQLRAAGAPELPRDLANDITLETGNMWHDHFERIFRARNLPVMCEVRINDYLPEGWRGRIDFLTWEVAYRAFKLRDLKTIKPEGIAYIKKDGAKDNHIWQVSAYWHAVADMGLPLLRTAEVYYLPKGSVPGTEIEPISADIIPLPRETVYPVMEERWRLTQAYLASFEGRTAVVADPLGWWVTPALAPETEREQALRWNKQQNVWDVKLVPHWSTNYCPYDNALCACSEQPVTKIGHWEFHVEAPSAQGIRYVHRSGYENIEPEVRPSQKDIDKRSQS